jgi:hypothetical protein
VDQEKQNQAPAHSLAAESRGWMSNKHPLLRPRECVFS